MILVLGAGGNVGNHLCELLDETELEYRAAFRSPDKLEAALDQGVEAVEIDLARPQTVRAAMEDVSRVFLLTAASPQLAERERAAITAAVRANVELVVKVSVWDADTQDYSFASWHAPSEQALAASGLPHHLLRPNGFMQSLAQGMEATVRDHGTWYTAGARQRNAYVDARDVAACAAALLAAPPPDTGARNTWAPTGPQALDAGEVAATLARVIGKPVRAVDLDPDRYREGLLAAGLPQYMVDALVDMAVHPAAANFGRVTGDVETLTGSAPRMLQDYFQEVREDFLG